MNAFFRDAITSSRVGPCHEKKLGLLHRELNFVSMKWKGAGGSQQNIHRLKYILFKNMTECQYFLTVSKFHR
jgi:hypothetical protein